jgi:uroporphyrinogen-III synthase
VIYLFSPSKFDGVTNMPLIEFRLLTDNIDLSNYDLLLFTSANSAKLLNVISNDWGKYPAIAIGKESAKAIIELGGNPVYISNGYSKELAEDIKQRFNDKKILYIRPKVVATDHIGNLKSENINIDDVVLYETVCKKYQTSQRPPSGSILIFTSPSTIECFLNNFDSLENYKIVAIGSTTAKALPENIEYHLPSTQSIDECIKLSYELEK